MKKYEKNRKRVIEQNIIKKKYTSCPTEPK